ncbi:MFS transporter [Pedococcus sp. NPDC057267]|uniref:MFS transporter n=1 Tax=Pedococcus sp. NPDC057267 TaxID=3346077 RepID=UPI0036347338
MPRGVDGSPGADGSGGADRSDDRSDERAARRARWAVSAMFATNGALFAGVVPRYPDITGALHLSSAAFGTAVAGYGVGAVVAGPFAASLVRRFGSARFAVATTLGVAANLLLIGAAPTWALLATALALAGALDSLTDIAENAQGLRVERSLRRSVLGSMHAMWSVGAVAGGALGSAAAGLGVPVVLHLGVVGAVAALVALLAGRSMLPGHEALPQDEPGATAPPHRGHHVRRAGLLLALAAVASMGQLMEDVTATWSALYLRESLGAAAAVGGLGFVALQVTQTGGRLVGDRLVTSHGDRLVARLGVVLAGTAMTVALLVPSPASVIAAFAVVGLGIGTLIPAGLRAADAVPGLRAGSGLTVVGMGLRVTLLLSPLGTGLLAQARGLPAVLWVLPAAAVVVLLLSPSLPSRRAG